MFKPSEKEWSNLNTKLPLLDSEYLINNRSSDLLKYKDFFDSEFEIVDIREGTGKAQEHAIFICKTIEGILFEVNPEGTSKVRKEYYLNRNNLIGKYLTVKFQDFTDRGVPHFATGLGIRQDVWIWIW